MSVFTQFTTSSGDATGSTQYFVSSGTWIPNTNGWATFLAVGGGGGGAAATINSGGARNVYTTGGGAGALVFKRAYVTAGTTFTITVGAGGGRGTTSNGISNGSAGGATSITATNFTS